MVFSLFPSFSERLNNSDCDRPSLKLSLAGDNKNFTSSLCTFFEYMKCVTSCMYIVMIHTTSL